MEEKEHIKIPFHYDIKKLEEICQSKVEGTWEAKQHNGSYVNLQFGYLIRFFANDHYIKFTYKSKSYYPGVPKVKLPQLQTLSLQKICDLMIILEPFYDSKCMKCQAALEIKNSNKRKGSEVNETTGLTPEAKRKKNHRNKKWKHWRYGR
jgi:hypothetical protein